MPASLLLLWCDLTQSIPTPLGTEQASQARLLAEQWEGTRALLQRVVDVWRAAAATTWTDDDGQLASSLALEEGERAALRRVALAGLQLMANLTAGFSEGATRVFEARWRHYLIGLDGG